MKSLFEQSVYEETVARIENLTIDTIGQWGKMNVAQMLAHCAEVQEVLNGEKELENTSFLIRVLLKGIIRKSVFGDKPYSKNGKTHPQYVIVDQREFETEKKRLLAALERALDSRNEVRRHTVFGDVPPKERGNGSYKHLDHHLIQFGV